jgi:hypothetical protein
LVFLGGVVVKALPMLVPESVLLRTAEKKREKKGILDDSEEHMIFGKTLNLPYLDFTYRYSAEKGFRAKQTVVAEGRSVLMAIREASFGFAPELISLIPQLSDLESPPETIIPGIDSTTLVNEMFDELRKTLSEYDQRLLELSGQYDSLQKADSRRDELKDNIDHLKRTRETRWKIFADGLKLPPRTDLNELEVVEGHLFYMPYFIAGFDRDGESRFLVWDRDGKEDDVIADELTKNGRFRELVLSHTDESESSEDQVNEQLRLRSS